MENVVSQSKDGQRRMVIIHKDGQSLTQHQQLVNGAWVHSPQSAEVVANKPHKD